MSAPNPNLEQFEAYFLKADLDRDGRISGNEAVVFLQGSNLPRHVLAQIWMYADHNKVGSLGRPEFYNALKLVTVAQSKRELTPDIVKAALYGPASVKIPAPQMNLTATSNTIPSPSPGRSDAFPATAQGTGLNSLQGSLTPPSHGTRPPRPLPATNPGFISPPAISSQGASGVNIPSVSQHSSLLVSQGGVSSHVSDRSFVPSANQVVLSSSVSQPKLPEVSGLLQSSDSSKLISQDSKEVSKEILTKGNGFSSDSVLGDSVSTVNSESQQKNPTGSVSTMPTGSLTSQDKPTVNSNSAFRQTSTGVQQLQLNEKENQQALAKKPPSVPVAVGQSHSPWPRMTQSDVQRYSKVFLQVDRDQDGKITGEQARTLFLSWRLPREILKQVWDLSDQDNDSMLSSREFCIALYLMERYREGRQLPSTLPESLIFDQPSVPPSSQPAVGNTSWRPYPVYMQTHGENKNARPTASAGTGKPPRPVPVQQPDESIQQKPKVPVLEKHLMNQLSTEEQDSLSKKFEEAKDSEKKVADLEKEILEAKQKIQFYHTKMQELILYKSRCDNRLNEITEKVVADKREADSLAKKYEEKYKEIGDVASKLTLEEATFSDIQERKIELYGAILKLEQENPDGFEDRATQIHSDLEVLVKALSERCKTYGLRGKPTSLVELPFGWQPGLGVAAADWDDSWDTFEDEGFTCVEELTLEVENIVAPPKQKTSLKRESVAPLLDQFGAVKSPSSFEKKEISSSGENVTENDGQSGTPDSEQAEKSRTGGFPAGQNYARSMSKEFQDFRMEMEIYGNGSPHAFDTRSEYGTESVLSGEARFDEPHWGSFDANYDTDSAWDFNSVSPKGGNRSDGFIFSGDDWGLNPIRTGVSSGGGGGGPFFDSVPSTPLYGSAATPQGGDSLFVRNGGPFGFADSVPSTPMYVNNSSPSSRRNDVFSRFDSFGSVSDAGGGPFRDSFARFDSMRSTARDSDYDQGRFSAAADSTSLSPRFDSFRSSNADSYDYYSFGQGQQSSSSSLARFDSMRSTGDYSEHGFGTFPSFDDPFGGDTFRTSQSPEAQTPPAAAAAAAAARRGGSESGGSWKAF